MVPSADASVRLLGRGGVRQPRCRRRRDRRGDQELLELGSGGGNNASHLKARFTCTLTDISPDMLALSQTLNPECEHLEGDMRTLRLGREFDVVFIHDAISYLTTEDDLGAAIETAAAHTRPGGLVILTPDATTENLPAKDRPRRPRRRGRSQPPLSRMDPSGRRVDLRGRLPHRSRGAGCGGASRPRPPHARRLSASDLGATDLGRGPGARRHHRREPVELEQAVFAARRPT